MFVHLHRHSEWSLGDGTGSAEQYAERAAEIDQTALAITDHGSLAGTLYHIQACEKVGIKPILGMEAYFRPDIEQDRKDKNRFGFYHLVLLAQNEIGWKNLMKISSLSHDDAHFYQKPCADWELLKANSEGLIATSSCLNGCIPQALLNDELGLADELFSKMKNLFGDRFYFEIQPHSFDEQKIVNQKIIQMAESYNVPFVATTDAHSPFEDWTETQRIRVLIEWGKKLADDKGEEGEDKEYGGLATTYLMDENEVFQSFKKQGLKEKYINAALDCSIEIANRCEAITVDPSPKIPRASASLMDAEITLRKWCMEGLERIGKQEDEVYLDRLNEELMVMRKLKVLDYFIIVADMVRWAKDNGIRVGPGRGSAGGSLVCYLTRITAMDPIGYDLLFERFLNEFRTEIPDIDFDIDPLQRQRLKDYLSKRWGSEYVVDVAAFQSFGLKAAVQGVARVLGTDFVATKKATDAIPKITYGETLESLEEQLPELKEYFKKFPEVEQHSKRLQGQIKASSKHPAAVIVTPFPAYEMIPLMRAKDERMVTQWSERANANLLSPYGFLKIDMLVTDALTAQASALEMIEERRGIKINFEDPKAFPVITNPILSEDEVIETLGQGRNLGIFQFGTATGSEILSAVQPTNLDHVIAANALNRPGANANVGSYAARKNGSEEWSLPHEAVEPFLSKTFGWLVYQEQVMQVYRALGKDVTGPESALFIKVAAKGIARDIKGKERLQAYYDKFEAGCKEKGIPKKSYDEIWKQILQMTTYSFNRSHSAGYALQAYFDAWIKYHYPQEFFASLLSTEEDKVPQIIREARHYGVLLKPPHINKSDATFVIDGEDIRFGLIAIKDVGIAALQEIREKRPFKDYEDFEQRVEKRKCNAKVKKALAKAGAFDEWGARDDWSDQEKAAAEKETIGISLSTMADITKYNNILDEIVTPYSEVVKVAEAGEQVFAGGEIIKLSEHQTRKGNPYKRADLEYNGNVTHCTFWTPKYNDVLEEGQVILVSGKFDVGRNNLSVANCATAEHVMSEMDGE